MADAGLLLDSRRVMLLAVGLTALGLVLADALLRRAEARGWIYYRRRSGSGSVSSAVFGPAFDLAQPTRQILAEEQQHQELLREDAGDSEPRFGTRNSTTDWLNSAT